MKKWPYRPSLWSTNKDRSKAERVIVCEVAKDPRVTSKQLKAFLTLANVHESTIRRTLSNHDVHEESHCSPKITLLAKDHVDKPEPEDYWRKG